MMTTLTFFLKVMASLFIIAFIVFLVGLILCLMSEAKEHRVTNPGLYEKEGEKDE